MRYHNPDSEPSREARLAAIKRRVVEGEYDSPERLAAAVHDLFKREFAEPSGDTYWNLDEDL